MIVQDLLESVVPSW